MRRVFTVLCFAAMAALATASAHAWYDGICLDNTDNTSTDPHATTNGLAWIDKGSGPALLNEDINMQFFCGATANSLALMTNLNYDGHPTQTGPQYSTFLLSDLTATAGYPVNTGWGIGTFFGGGLFIDPYGIEWVTMVPPEGTPAYFQIQAWTGNYNTYQDAHLASATGVAGVYVAQSTIFTNHVALGSFPIEPPTDLTNMPALVLKSAAFPGDANGDGTVNINDLSKVLTNYDRTGMGWTDGDFNGDHTVNINDLSVVLTNYDKTAGSAAAGIAAVPEPGTLALLAAALFGTLVYISRKHG